MREWSERRGEVLASAIATLHFIRVRAGEWRHLFGMLSLMTSEDAGTRCVLERWRYLGTWFHPHLLAWVHDLRYREREDGVQVCLRVPVSEEHRPSLGSEALARARATSRRIEEVRAPPQVELVITGARGRAFALVVPVAAAPFVWRCVREALFPAREEVVVLH